MCRGARGHRYFAVFCQPGCLGPSSRCRLSCPHQNVARSDNVDKGEGKFIVGDMVVRDAAQEEVEKYRAGSPAPAHRRAFLPVIVSTSRRIPGGLLRMLHIITDRQKDHSFHQGPRRARGCQLCGLVVVSGWVLLAHPR